MQMMQAMSVEMDALYTVAWLLKALALWLPSDGQLSNAVYFRRFFSRLHINPSASMACLLNADRPIDGGIEWQLPNYRSGSIHSASSSRLCLLSSVILKKPSRTFLIMYELKYTVSQKNWATFLRPITLEILNRSLPNLA